MRKGSGSRLPCGQRSSESGADRAASAGKIERYEADLDELQIRLEEQNEVVAEAAELQEENEARAEAAELEVDELKSQLADYQQALDVQQTRAIQYNRRCRRCSVPKSCAICRT